MKLNTRMVQLENPRSRLLQISQQYHRLHPIWNVENHRKLLNYLKYQEANRILSESFLHRSWGLKKEWLSYQRQVESPVVIKYWRTVQISHRLKQIVYVDHWEVSTTLIIKRRLKILNQRFNKIHRNSLRRCFWEKFILRKRFSKEKL